MKKKKNVENMELFQNDFTNINFYINYNAFGLEK